jgi:membrane protein required for colicin V production
VFPFGLFGGLFLALRYHAPLAELLLEILGWPSKVCIVIAFTSLFLLTILFFGVLGFLLSRFVKLLFLGGFNRVAGGLFGLVQGGLLVTLVLFGLSRSPLPQGMRACFCTITARASPDPVWRSFVAPGPGSISRTGATGRGQRSPVRL